MKLLEDFRTISELKHHTREVMTHAKQTGRPVVVTVDGKPEAVLMDAATFEKQQQAFHLAALVARGEADVRAGRTQPADEVIRELRRHARRVRR